MNEQKLTAADIRQFTGTEHLYRHTFIGHVHYTDGIKYLAKVGRAYWLLDHIALHQNHPKFKNQPFQNWKFCVDLEKSSEILTCTDGNTKTFSITKLAYTDFPLPEISIYVCHNVILLPSEY